MVAFVFILVSYFSGGSSSRLAYHWVRLKPSGQWKHWAEQPALQLPHAFREDASNDTTTEMDDPDDRHTSRSFDITGSDVIVFLQIQNAGANFLERRLIEDLVLQRPCTCRKGRKICHCYRPRKRSSWLFSRYTLGWKCGVHPDWTELINCVDRVLDEDEGKPTKRRYFYITVLRDPVTRFRSEWRRFHQNRGWHGSRPHVCPEHFPTTPTKVCFENRWPGNVSLTEFLSCPRNPALNRQTHMLADQGLVVDGCSQNGSGALMSTEDHNIVLLVSAKRNLHRMAFFGLAEFPHLSQSLFEATFNLKFGRRARPRAFLRGRWKSGRDRGSSAAASGEIEQMASANRLDVELYAYAKELLFSRFHKLGDANPSMDERTEKADSEENWAEEEDFFDNL